MIGNRNRELEALDRLADALVEDTLDTSDEDILAEFRDDKIDPDRHAVEMRTLFESSAIAVNKQRLLNAKAEVAANRMVVVDVSVMINLKEARQRLRAAFETKNLIQRLTVAARKESELSDADIISMADDLRELGVLAPTEDIDRKS